MAIFTWFAGSVAFGVAIRRARVLPSWTGVVLPLATASAIVGSEGGTSILTGVFLIDAARRLAAEPATVQSNHLAAQTLQGQSL